METNFDFNSQVCTDKNQSERLLALGLKKETADMCWQTTTLNGEPIKYPSQDVWINGSIITNNHFPAWSLHRLIEMMPDIIKDHIDEMLYHLSIDCNSVFYENKSFDLCQFFGDNLYVCIIDCIAYLIKEGYFNKEYLV